ncbi:hypothetical protein POPTR_016G062950v4 [Populus trichocarpa]|uniref:Uncharacterized protein n=1 Tax=Populus trichocarpa TaxID=3694 RepID=A0ACC0RSN2_POPTR|nr:hypothetical protein POPTR_016G062950v4 [Populus trichocarpa]
MTPPISPFLSLQRDVQVPPPPAGYPCNLGHNRPECFTYYGGLESSNCCP